MRKPISLLPVLLLAILLPSMAQQPAHKPKIAPLPSHPAPVVPNPGPKKYPSLLWEISGNGLKKPSYLFGTMHVSDKLAFHLGDSFYTAIKSADVVALETNPESWQDDYSQSVFFRGNNNRRGGGNLQRETRLAASAGTRQREQMHAGVDEQRGDRANVALTSYGRSRLRRKARRFPARGA